MCNPFCWLQGLVVNQVVNDDCSGFPASWYSDGCFVVVMFLCFFFFLTVKEELLDKNRLSCFMPGSAALAAADSFAREARTQKHPGSNY